MTAAPFKNPYRPGAGHMPPHLAGRELEYAEFDKLLEQETILENMVLTGLRGVGKTVLLETLRPRAMQAGWLWTQADLSESASVSEATLAQRILADLSLITASLTVDAPQPSPVGFGVPSESPSQIPLSYEVLVAQFESTPGLIEDKVKAVLEFAWHHIRHQERHRVIFAYDEAQNLSDNAPRDQFPLSMLLDVFQSIQKKDIPFMLVLTGLPTLFPKLVDARTFAERMFRVVTLGRLDEVDSREAILTPIEQADCPVRFNEDSVTMICRQSGGYPYFIQFICREIFDVFIQQIERDQLTGAPMEPIQRKLDADFFAGRWSRVTDRQRQLLWVVASLHGSDEEFTIQELVAMAKRLLPKPFSSSHANQMLSGLAGHGLIYKSRTGKYSFAVPMLGDFILRTYDPPIEHELPF